MGEAFSCVTAKFGARKYRGLRDKDLELEDLRGGGATLSLPKLETTRFVLDSFLENQKADKIEDPMNFLINKDVALIMSMANKVIDKHSNGTGKDEVDINEVKNVDNSSQSKPVMLSSKRAIEKPDLSKYKSSKSSKKAKLSTRVGVGWS